MASTPDCGQLWIGHLSGIITVHAYTVGTMGKIEFSLTSATVLLAHRSRVTVISLSRIFSVACSGDGSGIIVIWDLNRYRNKFYIFEHREKKSYVCVSHICILLF